MNKTITKAIAIFFTLAALLAATRMAHFGSAVSLPDASLAVFFLGGLYLGRKNRISIASFVVLILAAGYVDYYATSILGVSDWCMTPAYWFLIPTYGGLWYSGRWFALRHSMENRGLVGLFLIAWGACSIAFLFSNATFFVFSEYFSAMGAGEYITRVSQYYVPYISAALFYIAFAVGLQMLLGTIGKRWAHHQSKAT